MYDVSRRDSFERLDNWLYEVEQYSMAGGKDVIKLLVGNKIDKHKDVKKEEAEEWARSQGMLFMQASAKTREGISNVFDEVVHKILENPNLLSHTRPQRSGQKTADLHAKTKNERNSSCC